jgi:hypothetical protein
VTAAAVDPSPSAFVTRQRWQPAIEALIALSGCAALLVWQIVAYRGSDDQDAAIHALYARFPSDPGRIVSPFARPLFAVLYIGPGLLGYTEMRIFTILICLLTAWVTYRIAVRLGLAYAWIAIPFVVLQPVLYQLGAETMTEPVFALTLAVGMLAFVSRHPITAAVAWSFLPLARPEGPIVLAVIGAMWTLRALQRRSSWHPIPFLAVGSIIWYIAALLSTGDPRYISNTFPWAFNTSTIHGAWLHYVLRWPGIVGVGVMPLSVIGVVAAWKRAALRLALAIIIAVLAVHTYLWAAGRFASWGFDRYFATITPLSALLAVAGADTLARWHPRVAQVAVAILIAFEAVQAFLAVDMSPLNYMAAATAETVHEADTRIGLRGHHVISADHYGYLFTDRGNEVVSIPLGDSAAAAGYMAEQPRGTVILWDNQSGYYWYHLTPESIVAAGYRVVWDKNGHIGSWLVPVYDRWRLYTHPRLYHALGWGVSWRDVRQTVLIRE